MIIVDRMLIGGIKFVLRKVAAAVDAELNDDSRLREELLAAQMQLELGEITEEQYQALEAELLPRLREIQEARKAAAEASAPGAKIVGVEASVFGTDDGDEVPAKKR